MTAVAVPASGVLGLFTAWFIERTRLPGRGLWTLLGGLLLVLLDTLVEFDAFVALKYQTFSVSIYSQYQLSFSASGAAALSLISIVLCVFVLLGESRLRGRATTCA